MLQIIVPETEQWDELNQEFISTKEQVLCLEHSLVSLSKWESKWHKPFLDKKEKTPEEVLDYIRCMTISQNIDPNVYRLLSKKNIEEINKYIQDSMTATWFQEKDQNKMNSEVITSELIYYWMVSLQIPFECQKWHLNRLLTLIKVCDVKSQKPKKYSKNETMSKNAALNAARKKKFGTSG